MKKILSIIFATAMLGSCAYAAVVNYDADIFNGFSTGAVKIDMTQECAKDDNIANCNYDDYQISSNETISSILKIKNIGAPSYLRIRVNSINQDSEPTEEPAIVDLGANWQKIGDYYYLTRIAESGENITVFSSFTAPESWESNQRITTIYNAEAIQAANFNPDFSSAMPWGDVTITRNTNGVPSDSSSQSSTVTISYENSADQYIQIPDSFLAALNNLMPGSQKCGDIHVENNANYAREFFISGSLTGDKLGEVLHLNIANGGNSLYDGLLKNFGEISLGEYYIGDSSDITFCLSLPENLGNEYANIPGDVNWVIRAAGEALPNPKTDDNIRIALIIFIISLVGLIITTRKRKNENTQQNI